MVSVSYSFQVYKCASYMKEIIIPNDETTTTPTVKEYFLVVFLLSIFWFLFIHLTSRIITKILIQSYLQKRSQEKRTQPRTTAANWIRITAERDYDRNGYGDDKATKSLFENKEEYIDFYISTWSCKFSEIILYIYLLIALYDI